MNEKVYHEKFNRNQAAILEAVFKYRDTDVCAGRKFGKTRTASTAVRDLIMEWRPGLYVIGAPTNKYLKDQNIRELQAVFPTEILKSGSWEKAYNKSDMELSIIYQNEPSSLLLRTMEGDAGDAVRPLSVDAFIMEEFGLWPRYAWDYCVKPTLMAKKAKTLKIYTPNGMNHAYEEYNRKAPDHKTFLYTSYDGILPREEIDRMAETMAEGIYRQEILAEFLSELGGVFRGIDRIVAGDFEEPHATTMYVAGVDLARTTDFNTIYIMNTETNHIVFMDRFHDLDWHIQERKIYDSLMKYNNAYAYVDMTGVGDRVVQELDSMGLRVFGYVFSNKSKAEMVENLLIMIRNRKFTMPDDPTTINELRIFQVEQLPSGKVRYNAPQGYHDDCVTGLGLCCLAKGSNVETGAVAAEYKDHVDTRKML